MRSGLVALLVFLPLVQAQDSPVLKAVEPRYDQYSQDLTTNYVDTSASVTIKVLANGKPLALESSTVALPMAVVMAPKDYEFRPQGTIPHGRPDTDGSTFHAALTIPIRQPAAPRVPAPIRVSPGIARASMVSQARPEYPEYARHNRIQGKITFEAVITTEGYVDSLKVRNGPFVLIEAAHAAVKQGLYRPTKINGEAVEVATEIQVNYTLD